MFQKLFYSRFTIHVSLWSSVFFVVGALAFYILSLGQDSYPEGNQNIAFVLDVSRSMQVQDVSNTSRLSAAKNDIYTLVSRHTGIDFSLTIFAGESLRVLPFTSDISLLATVLLGTDSDNVVKQGSEIEEALSDAVESFGEERSGKIIIYTDGDDEEFVVTDKITASIKAKDLEVYVIGVGSKEGGPIPTGNVFSPYKTYQGAIVNPQLNESGLKKLAQKIGGKYVKLGDFIDLEGGGHTQNKNIVFVFLYLAALSWGVFLYFIFRKIYI